MTYLVLWPNKTVAIVRGATKKRIFQCLDEAGDPCDAKLILLDELAERLRLSDEELYAEFSYDPFEQDADFPLERMSVTGKEFFGGEGGMMTLEGFVARGLSTQKAVDTVIAESMTGWGYTKKPTAQRDKPKLHYFDDGRSLCHGTAPIEIRNFTHPEKSPHACPTCLSKKRALDKRRAA